MGTHAEAARQRQIIRQDKLDAAFAGKKFNIVDEVHLPKGQVFKTQFGSLGRDGFIIRDIESGQEYVVGATLLEYIRDQYSGIVD